MIAEFPSPLLNLQRADTDNESQDSMADLPTLKPATDNPMVDAEPSQSRQPKVKSGVRTSSACLGCRRRRTKVSIGNYIRQYSLQPTIAHPTSLPVHWNWTAMRVMRQARDGVHI
jgi:hypothetical protein